MFLENVSFWRFLIFKTNFLSFSELDQLTGVAAILRFPIPDLDEEELEEEEDVEEEGFGGEGKSS